MLIDNSLILDAGLTLTTTGSSTNYIDTIGASGGQAQISGVNTIQGGGDAYEQLWWEVLVLTTVTGSAGAGIDFQLWTSPVASSIWTTGNAGSLPVVGTAALGTAGVNKLLSTGFVPVANLVSSAGTAGAAYTYKARLPQGIQRYIAGFYNIFAATTGLTAGKWASLLMPDIDINLT